MSPKSVENKFHYGVASLLTIKIATKFFSHKVLLKPIMIMLNNTSRWEPLVDWRSGLVLIWCYATVRQCLHG
jgi:hypothetical protein